MEYLAYQKLNNTEIEWLKEIPENWKVIKVRFLFSFGRGLGITKSNLKDEGIPCINYGEIHSKYGFEVIPELHELKCVEESYLISNPSALLKKGDFIFADTSEDLEGSGNFSYLNSDIPTFAGYHTVTAKLNNADSHPKYIAYLLHSSSYRFQIRKNVLGVKVFSITQKILKNSYVWLPPKKEQIQIAEFLDYKTQQIDQLIKKKKELIEKLNEQRIAVITSAVTKGLDENVKMKPSYVDWLGEVPEHWEIRRTKFNVSHIGSGKTPLGGAEVYIDRGVMLLRSQNVYDDGLRLSNVAYISEEADLLQKSSRIQDGDVLLNITGASIGRSSFIPNNFPPSNVNQHVCILRPINKLILSGYLHLLLYSQPAKYQIMMNQIGTSREGLTFPQVGDITFPLPCLNEQKKILNYCLENKNRNLLMIEKVQSAISRLEEYRSAIITSAVTGIIDVRNVLFNKDVA